MIKTILLIIALVFSSLTTTVIYHKTQQSDIKYYQGHRLSEKGKYREAIPLYKESLSIKPLRIDALKELAYCYQWTSNQPEAIKTFQKIISLKPRDYSIKKSLAESLSWEKNYDEAIMLYENIISVTGGKDAKLKLAEVYIWDDQPQKAKEILQSILRDSPNDFTARLLLAQAMQYSDEAAKAIAILNELLKEKIPLRNTGEIKNKLSDLLVEAYISNKDYKNAESILQERIKASPDDLKARILLGKVYLYSADYARAQNIFEAILKDSPDNTDALVLLADTFAYGEDFDRAEPLYREAVKKSKNLETKRKLADALSWNGKYDEAVKIYNEILAQRESKRLRLQKARILGWQHKYSRSLEEYRNILKIGYDADIELEMLAKTAYWNNRVKHAISYYEDLIAGNARNLEAAFDLSQVYSYQSMWPKAINTYEKILAVSPNHFRAKDGLEKAKLISGSSSLQPGYEYYRAESPSRDTNIRKQSLSSEFTRPLNYNLTASGAYKLTFRSFADYGDVLENEGKFKLTYINNPNWRAAAYYDFITYNKDIDTMHTFGASANLRTFDYGTLGFYYDRERLENNSGVILGHFYSDNYKERLAIDINKNLKFGFDYLFARYSDSNYKHEPGFDVLYYLSFEPKRFTVKYRYFYKTFEKTVTDYFSPKNFSTNSLALNWRHYLNRKDIYFGARNLYYDAGYEASVDSTDIVGHKFSGEVGWDINKKLNINIKGSVVNSSCEVYKEENIMASLKYYF